MYGSPALPRGGILSYEQAVARHNSIVPIRGRSSDVRPLGKRRNENLTIRMDPKERVLVRLYQTDVVVYNPDGTIELEPYASSLTNELVRHLLSRAVTPNYTSKVGPALCAKDADGTQRWFRIPDYAVLDKDHRLIGGSEPFTRYRIDRKASNEALARSGFRQFSLWLTALIRIGNDPRQGNYWAGVPLHDSVIRSLDEPDRYTDIVRGWAVGKPVTDQLALLRLAVQRYHDAVVTETVPYVSNWRELRAVEASHRRLG